MEHESAIFGPKDCLGWLACPWMLGCYFALRVVEEVLRGLGQAAEAVPIGIHVLKNITDDCEDLPPVFLWSFSANLWYMQVYNLLYREFFHRDFGRTRRMVYREHLARVIGLTAKRGRKLLVWDLKEGWAPICKFLGKPVSQEHFPHGNTGAHFNERLAIVVLDEQVRAK